MLRAAAGRVPVLLMARELGIGGSERQLCEMARRLDRSHFEPHVGCLRAGGFRAQELRAAGVPILELGVSSFLRPQALTGAWKLGRYLREHRIEIVHTFDAPLNEFGVPLARAFGVPTVLSSQRAHRELVSAADRHLLRLTDLMVDGIVVNSAAVRRALLEEERVPASRIHVCYNGIDTELFRPAPRARPPELRGAGLVVGVVCAFRPEKDLATLLRAFARVRDARPGLRLVLVGGGPSLDALQALGAELALPCEFVPPTHDVPRWLRAIDIFVLPSTSEALSNSLMEAMACGLCAIASRVGGNPELVEHERTGLLFRAGDAGDLAGCLRRVIEDGALRERLAEAGGLFIRRNFTLEAAARRMGEIYTALL